VRSRRSRREERAGVRVLRHCTPGAGARARHSREHITSADEVASSHGGIIDDLILLAQEVVELEGIRESGYRLVMNVGRTRR